MNFSLDCVVQIKHKLYLFSVFRFFHNVNKRRFFHSKITLKNQKLPKLTCWLKSLNSHYHKCKYFLYVDSRCLLPTVTVIAEWLWLKISIYKYWRINFPCQLNIFWQTSLIQAIMLLCFGWFKPLCQFWNANYPVLLLFVINFYYYYFCYWNNENNYWKWLSEKHQNEKNHYLQYLK